MRDIDNLVDRKLQSSWGRRAQREDELPPRGRLHQIIGHHPEKQTDWDEVLKLSQSTPKQVMETDLRGRTCLSTSCARNPPASVVKVMLKACRFGTEASRDKTGNTALHIAIQANATLEAIQELCTSHRLVKTTDHRSNTALHLACRNTFSKGAKDLVQLLLEAYPEAVHLTDADGKTPLDIALQAGAPSVITELLRRGRSATPEPAVSSS